MRDILYRERQLWSGNESVEIWYVSGSSVAGTSASSPVVPRHMYIYVGFLYNVYLVNENIAIFLINIRSLRMSLFIHNYHAILKNPNSGYKGTGIRGL